MQNAAPDFSLKPTSGVQRKESLTTGSFPAVQFNSSQKPFVAFGNVPKAVGQENQNQPFAVSAGQPKAVAGEKLSDFFVWPSPLPA